MGNCCLDTQCIGDLDLRIPLDRELECGGSRLEDPGDGETHRERRRNQFLTRRDRHLVGDDLGRPCLDLIDEDPLHRGALESSTCILQRLDLPAYKEVLLQANTGKIHLRFDTHDNQERAPRESRHRGDRPHHLGRKVRDIERVCHAITSPFQIGRFQCHTLQAAHGIAVGCDGIRRGTIE